MMAMVVVILQGAVPLLAYQISGRANDPKAKGTQNWRRFECSNQPCIVIVAVGEGRLDLALNASMHLQCGHDHSS
jgi:hypothetical protein